jgi:hypothetical protein
MIDNRSADGDGAKSGIPTDSASWSLHVYTLGRKKAECTWCAGALAKKEVENFMTSVGLEPTLRRSRYLNLGKLALESAAVTAWLTRRQNEHSKQFSK